MAGKKRPKKRVWRGSHELTREFGSIAPLSIQTKQAAVFAALRRLRPEAFDELAAEPFQSYVRALPVLRAERVQYWHDLDDRIAFAKEIETRTDPKTGQLASVDAERLERIVVLRDLRERIVLWALKWKLVSSSTLDTVRRLQRSHRDQDAAELQRLTSLLGRTLSTLLRWSWDEEALRKRLVEEAVELTFIELPPHPGIQWEPSLESANTARRRLKKSARPEWTGYLAEAEEKVLRPGIKDGRMQRLPRVSRSLGRREGRIRRLADQHSEWLIRRLLGEDEAELGHEAQPEDPDEGRWAVQAAMDSLAPVVGVELPARKAGKRRARQSGKASPRKRV